MIHFDDDNVVQLVIFRNSRPSLFALSFPATLNVLIYLNHRVCLNAECPLYRITHYQTQTSHEGDDFDTCHIIIRQHEMSIKSNQKRHTHRCCCLS